MSQNIKPTCPLHEAVDMVYRQIGKGGDDAWRRAIINIAYATGWHRGKLEAAIDRRYDSWCEANGYDYQ